MKERNVNMKLGERLHIKYNEYELIITNGCRNSLVIEGIDSMQFNDIRATSISTPKPITIILREG